MHRWLGLSVMAALLSACIPYPAYRTLQPQTQLQVLDAHGRPLAGAQVTLIGEAHATPVEHSRVTRSTDAGGIARFASRHAWKSEMLFLHGRLQYYWIWCVSAPDHATLVAPFETPQPIRLQAGTPEPCPPPRG